MTIHFVVHEEGDSVGTIVVEDVKAGDALTGWIMEQDKTVNVKTLNDIPIGRRANRRSGGPRAHAARVTTSRSPQARRANNI